MTDIVERLRENDHRANVNRLTYREGADEIESLRQRLAESQAMALKFRGDIASYIAMEQGDDAAANYVARNPIDTSALDAAIREVRACGIG